MGASYSYDETLHIENRYVQDVNIRLLQKLTQQIGKYMTISHTINGKRVTNYYRPLSDTLTIKKKTIGITGKGVLDLPISFDSLKHNKKFPLKDVLDGLLVEIKIQSLNKTKITEYYNILSGYKSGICMEVMVINKHGIISNASDPKLDSIPIK